MCLNFFPMILHVVSSYDVRLCFGTCLKNMSESASEFGLNKKEMTFSAPCYLMRPSVVVGIDFFWCLALLHGTVIYFKTRPGFEVQGGILYVSPLGQTKNRRHIENGDTYRIQSTPSGPAGLPCGPAF